MNNVSFVVETMEVIDGEKLKDIKPDNDGYYELPLAVIGISTRNNTYYKPKEFINAITSPTSPFNIVLQDGCLYGEYGHPFTSDLRRIATVDEKNCSHHIKKVNTSKNVNGGTLITGSLKPFGPYGKYLEQSLNEKYMNTAFSLRSICTENYNTSSQVIERTIKLLVTFDAVAAPGYSQSTKRYANGNENFTIPLQRDDFYKEDGTSIACESKLITDGFITDLFGAKAVKFTTTSTPINGIYIPGNKNYIGNDGNRHSLVHALLKG